MLLSFAEKASSPVIYPLISCDDCKDEVTFGCLVSDFFPQPVTVTWVSSTTGTIETFPAVPTRNTYYSLSSQFTLPVSRLADNTFQCKVDHSSTDAVLTLDIRGEKGGSGEGTRGTARPLGGLLHGLASLPASPEVLVAASMGRRRSQPRLTS